MIIQCPRCQTKWRLDESLLSEDGSMVRCSRCGHEYLAFPPPPEAGHELDEPAGPPEADDLVDFLSESGPAADAALDELGEVAKGGWGRRIAVIVLLIVILAGLALGAILFFKGRGVHLDRDYLGFDIYTVMPSFLKPKSAAPDKAAEAERGVSRLHLDQVEGEYKNTAKSGQVFVIRGKVVNAFDQPVSEIKLRGFLHAGKNRNVAAKVVYAGNVLSDQDLNEMTPEVIDQLLLNPLGQGKANTNIAPGGEVDFMIVFFDLPKGLTEYTVEVVSSKLGTGAGSKK